MSMDDTCLEAGDLSVCHTILTIFGAYQDPYPAITLRAFLESEVAAI
jgi:hypothetical protein